MAKTIYLVIALAIFALSEVNAKTFTRCELARELKKQGFPSSQLRNWVCLVEAESGRRTDVVGGPNSNGSRDYGLFQINDRYWCSTGSSPGKDCNVRCQDLLTDNISKASTCAKKIYARHGFNAWYGWKNKCQGKSLPDISSCGV
ncbi:Lysozyme [Eumeta japonica]|uniref:Lysozyme n=1 Tax=Eumeta variegata TaxID=151549 RepID=A0A4C1U0E9_EUMVA|nr:Lysozyme [Eumeta japonica]